MGMGPTRDLGPAVIAWGATAIDNIFDEVRLGMEAVAAGEVFEVLFGATPVDTIFGGYSRCEVTVPATRILLATLATILPGGSTSGGASGLVAISPSATVGISMYDEGLPLIIKPISKGIAVVNGKWMRIEHAYPIPNFDVVFNLRDQRVYGITFKGHPDQTSKRLWSAGKVNTGTSY